MANSNKPGPTWRVQSVWAQHFDSELVVVAKGRRVATERTKMLAAATGLVVLLVVIGLGSIFEIVFPGLLLLIIGERIFGLFWPRRWVARGAQATAVFACGTWSSKAGRLIAKSATEIGWDGDVVFVEGEGIKLDAEQRTRLQHDLTTFEIEEAS